MSWIANTGAGAVTALAGATATANFVSLIYTQQGARGEDRVWTAAIAFVLSLGMWAPLGVATAQRFHGFMGGAASGCFLIALLYYPASFLVERYYWGRATMNGEPVMLQVELRMPPGWAPEQADAERLYCWLTPNGASRSGTVLWDRKWRETDGHWIVPCSLDLRNGDQKRKVGLSIGRIANNDDPDLFFELALPSWRFTERDTQWTEWSDQISSIGYKFRFRFQRSSAAKGIERP